MVRTVSKIALLLPNFAGGGAERVAITLAGGFHARGHLAHLVVFDTQGPLIELLPDGVKIVNLGVRRFRAGIPPLAAYLRRERPDALLSCLDIVNPLATWARLVASTSTKVLIGAHGNLSAHSREPSAWRYYRILPLLTRLSYRFADAVIAVSAGAADDLSRTAHIPRDIIRVIYNPVQVENILRQSQKELNHPWFAPGELPVILTAGRLTFQKDHRTLLQAFALIRRHRQARLVILGEGELRAELASLATELGIVADVTMPGFDLNPFRYMARSSVFVLSSRWEGLGNVLLEALACSPQVVSTDCPGGPAEILDHGLYGRLTPVGNPLALARALEAALDEPIPVEKLRARAGMFPPDKTVNAYLDALGLGRSAGAEEFI